MDCRPSDLDRRGWDALVSRQGGMLQQCWDWGAASGRSVHRFEVIEDGARVALAQVLGRPAPFGRAFGLLSRGPVLSDPVADANAVVAALGWRGPLFVTPPAGARLRGLALMTPATAAHWDLRPAEPALRAGLDQKWRNRLCRAEGAGLRVCPSNDLDWILAREEENRAAHRYRGLPAAFVARLCRRPGSHIILTARRGGPPLAGALFLIHGVTATYQTGWSGPAGRAVCAMNLLLWQGALRLKARGVRELDLDMIDTVTAPGLVRFKLGTGARAQPLGPTTWVWPRAWKMNPRKLSRTCAARIDVLPEGS